MPSRVGSSYTSGKFIKVMSIVVFFGSLWGITEATLGYLLHRINFSFGWCIWFPLAFYFMERIYKRTKEASHMFYGALIAAVIKLTNLFIEARVDKVINPSVSILLEAAAVYALYRILERGDKKPGFIGIAAVNFIWRIIYLTYLLFMPKSFISVSALRGLNPFLQFILLESAVNTLIISAYIIVRERLQENTIKARTKGINIKPVPSIAAFLFAIALQWIL